MAATKIPTRLFDIDSAPTGSSLNPATSGSIFDALALKATKATTITIFGAATATQDLSANRTYYPRSNSVQAQIAAGSTILGELVGIDSGASITTTTAMTSQMRVWLMVYLPEAATLTGVKFYTSTTGNFTASNFNGVGLYTASGGTLTQVAVTANDAAVWKQTAGQYNAANFTGTYVAAAGMYYVCLMYSQSAVVTVPALGACSPLGAANASGGDMTNSNFYLGTETTQTTMPSTRAASSITKNTSPRYYVGLY